MRSAYHPSVKPILACRNLMRNMPGQKRALQTDVSQLGDAEECPNEKQDRKLWVRVCVYNGKMENISQDSVRDVSRLSSADKEGLLLTSIFQASIRSCAWVNTWSEDNPIKARRGFILLRHAHVDLTHIMSARLPECRTNNGLVEILQSASQI